MSPNILSIIELNVVETGFKEGGQSKSKQNEIQ